MLQLLKILRSSDLKILFKELCTLFILAYLIDVANSTDWPNCSFQCNGGDVDVKDLWLGDVNGDRLPPCIQGSQTTAYLWARLKNNANDARYAVILLADIYVNGALQKSFYNQGLCILDVIPPKSVISMPICNFSCTCGQNVNIERLVLSWETAKGTSCTNANRRCSNRDAKCYGGANAKIQLNASPTCSIQGQNIACENSIGIYSPQIAGNPDLKNRFAWKIDGSEVQNISNDGSIEVDWKLYSSGTHRILLSVDWINESESVLAICNSEMKILVVKVPSADIELS